MFEVILFFAVFRSLISQHTTKNKTTQNKTLEKKQEKLQSDIESISNKIQNLKEEKETVKKIIAKYYNENRLKQEYIDRTDEDLIEHFKSGLLKKHQSPDVLLRHNEFIKILDIMRKEVAWQ